MTRTRAAAGVLIALVLALAPALAEARGGARGSFGSRGARTFQTAPATPTAPQAKPLERSMTQPGQTATQPGVASAARPGMAGSFAQRNPFMTGLMGGFLGAGLFGLLFGGGLFGAGFGGAAMLGLLLQIALIGGLAWLALRLWRGRQAANGPAYAHAGASPARSPEPEPDAPLLRTGAATGAAPGGGAHGPTLGDEIGVGETDYEAFGRVLTEVQDAWSRGDLAALKANLTPEMLSYFSEGLTNLASQGLENRVEDVKLEQGDLSEAWREGGRDYATVAMRWSARDWTEGAGGEVVEGDREARSEATEVWTFVRAAGGRWLLSAIQQV